jgi:hypothetical protein
MLPTLINGRRIEKNFKQIVVDDKHKINERNNKTYTMISLGKAFMREKPHTPKQAQCILQQ